MSNLKWNLNNTCPHLIKTEIYTKNPAAAYLVEFKIMRNGSSPRPTTLHAWSIVVGLRFVNFPNVFYSLQISTVRGIVCLMHKHIAFERWIVELLNLNHKKFYTNKNAVYIKTVMSIAYAYRTFLTNSRITDVRHWSILKLDKAQWAGMFK